MRGHSCRIEPDREVSAAGIQKPSMMRAIRTWSRLMTRRPRKFRGEVERQQQMEVAAQLERELELSEKDQTMQEEAGLVNLEALDAHWAQEWDDWAAWDGMHGEPSPPRTKRHLQIQGDNTQHARLEVAVIEGYPVTMGIT